MLVTNFESVNENSMKSYILEPKNRFEISGKSYQIIKGGLKNLYECVQDKYFVCIHLLYDSSTLVKSLQDFEP